MTYKINGTTIALQPTTGRWNNRDSIGVDGNGHAVYEGVREFEMEWGFMTASQYNELVGFFSTIGHTGTAVVDLPKFGAPSYSFYSYTGCVLREPELGEFFEEHVSSVRLLVVKIRT
jgi:hypothetical protein